VCFVQFGRATRQLVVSRANTKSGNEEHNDWGSQTEDTSLTRRGFEIRRRRSEAENVEKVKRKKAEKKERAGGACPDH